MTSLPKTMAKFGLLRNQTNYHSKGIDESYPKMYFLLNLSHYVKSYGHFCQILAFFMRPAHQIWTCDVTQETNFEFFYFVLILHLILGKSQNFQWKSSLLQTLSAKNLMGDGKHPPPPKLAVIWTIAELDTIC